MKRIQRRFEELEGQFQDLSAINESTAIRNHIRKWRSECLALLERVFGTESHTTKEFANLPELHKNKEYIQSLRASFLAAKADYETSGKFRSAGHVGTNRLNAIFDHWAKYVGAFLLIGIIGWFLGFGQSRLSEAEKHDVWKQLRSDDGDDGFVHAVSKRLQNNLDSKIQELDSKIAERKAELVQLKSEEQAARTSERVDKLKRDVYRSLQIIDTAIPHFRNAMDYVVVRQDGRRSLSNFDEHWREFGNSFEKLTSPNELPNLSGGFE